MAFEFGRRRVGYREGFGSQPLDSSTFCKTEIAGKQVEVSVNLDIRPLQEDKAGDPQWDGNVVLDKHGKPLPIPESFSNQADPIANIFRGLYNSLSSSPHTTLPVSRTRIQVKGYRYPLDIPSSVLAGGSAVILRKQLRQVGMGPLRKMSMSHQRSRRRLQRLRKATRLLP